MNFSDEIVKQIREQSVVNEQNGYVSNNILEYIFEKRLFKLFVPEELNGCMTSFPEAIKIFEECSYIDGSFGWIVTIGSGGGFFTPFIEPSIARDHFSNEKAVIAGSGAPTGTAKKVKNGFQVNGTWKYCSGSTHASFYTANCLIEGTEEIRAFIFSQDQIRIIEDWNSFGLKATSSHSIVVENQFIPEQLTFNFVERFKRFDHPTYHLPFYQFAETSFAAVTIGIGRHFIDAAKVLVKTKNEKWKLASVDRVSLVNIKIDEMECLFEQKIIGFYEGVNQLWEKHINNQPILEQELLSLSHSCKEVARTALLSAQSIFPFLGMEAVMETSEVNQVYRDLHTACQHTMLTPFYIIR